MTTIHVTDFYMDGRITVPYCKICSAEGLALFESCQGEIDQPFYFRDLSKKEFEEKYQNSLDQSKPKR